MCGATSEAHCRVIAEKTDRSPEMMYSEIMIAAEDAYRREQLMALRPPRRTRRSHRTRHPRPDHRRPWSRLVLSRSVLEEVDGASAA